MDIDNFSEYEAELLADGYWHGVPSPECNADRDIVENGERCATCGGALRFVPLVKHASNTARMSYLAFAVCRACNVASEF